MFEQVSRALGVCIVMSVIGYLSISYISQWTENLVQETNYKRTINEKLKTTTTELTDLEGQVKEIKGSLIKISSIPQNVIVSAQLDLIGQKLGDIDKRLSVFEGFATDNPEKAYKLLILQKELNRVQDITEKTSKDSDEKIQKQADRIDNLLLGLFAGAVGLLIFMLGSFKFRKETK